MTPIQKAKEIAAVIYTNIIEYGRQAMPPDWKEYSETTEGKALIGSVLSGEDWISVEDKPLVNWKEINGKKYWTVNDGVPEEFLAAVQYHDKSTTKDHWWIRHCTIVDQTGLHVVTDDDTEPAGWEIESVEYYMPLPEPPKP